MKVLIDTRKKSDLPLSFIHNNRELTIPIDIANAFNSYFAAIGRNIAAGRNERGWMVKKMLEFLHGGKKM